MGSRHPLTLLQNRRLSLSHFLALTWTLQLLIQVLVESVDPAFDSSLHSLGWNWTFKNDSCYSVFQKGCFAMVEVVDSSIVVDHASKVGLQFGKGSFAWFAEEEARMLHSVRRLFGMDSFINS